MQVKIEGEPPKDPYGIETHQVEINRVAKQIEETTGNLEFTVGDRMQIGVYNAIDNNPKYLSRMAIDSTGRIWAESGDGLVCVLDLRQLSATINAGPR